MNRLDFSRQRPVQLVEQNARRPFRGSEGEGECRFFGDGALCRAGSYPLPPPGSLRAGAEEFLLQRVNRGGSPVAVEKDGFTALADDDNFFPGMFADTSQSGSRRFRIGAKRSDSGHLSCNTLGTGTEEDDGGDRPAA